MAICFSHYSIQFGAASMLYKSDRVYYTIGEVAVRLGISSKQVSEKARHGGIPGIQRLGGSWVVAEEQLDHWLDAVNFTAATPVNSG